MRERARCGEKQEAEKSSSGVLLDSRPDASEMKIGGNLSGSDEKGTDPGPN